LKKIFQTRNFVEKTVMNDLDQNKKTYLNFNLFNPKKNFKNEMK